MSPTHSGALSASKPLAAAQPHATSVRPAVDKRLDPHRELGNGLPGVSNTFTGTLPAGLSRLTKLLAVCVPLPTPLCIPAGLPCRLARGLVVSGRQESLQCRPTRQLSRLVLRPSSVDSLVRSHLHSLLLHPTDRLGRARVGIAYTQTVVHLRHVRLLERPQETVGAEDSHRCDVRLF